MRTIRSRGVVAALVVAGSMVLWPTATASAAPTTLTLVPASPDSVVVPADGAMRGGVTEVVTSGGSPQSGVAVSATETDPGGSQTTLPGCTTSPWGS